MDWHQTAWRTQAWENQWVRVLTFVIHCKKLEFSSVFQPHCLARTVFSKTHRTNIYQIFTELFVWVLNSVSSGVKTVIYYRLAEYQVNTVLPDSITQWGFLAISASPKTGTHLCSWLYSRIRTTFLSSFLSRLILEKQGKNRVNDLLGKPTYGITHEVTVGVFVGFPWRYRIYLVVWKRFVWKTCRFLCSWTL